MRGIGTKLAAAAVVALCAGATTPARADVVVSGVTILSPGSTVAGQTIGQWTANWWQWAEAQGAPTDAFSDGTGARAGQNQSGPVFFVAGTANGMPSPTLRSFNVPGDAYLLIPMLNVEQSQAEYFATYGIANATNTQLMTELTNTVNLIDSLHASIDGVAVPGDLFLYKETSDVFSYVADPNNVFGSPAGPSGNAIAQGYYLMLAPLGNSTHTVSFGGGVSEFQFSVAVTDTINSPEPGSLSLFAAGLAGLALLQRRRMLAGLGK